MQTVQKNGKNRIKNAVKKESENKGPIGIYIPAPDIRSMKVRIVGDSPIIYHKFGAKMRKMMLDKQTKKANTPRKTRNPHEDYIESLYFVNGEPTPAQRKGNIKPGECGFPASGFKQAAVSACRYVEGMKMTFAKGAFFVRTYHSHYGKQTANARRYCSPP